jgi:hypothetical protein
LAEEETVSLRQKYLTTLTYLAPAGAVGMSMALGAAAPAAASTAQPAAPDSLQPPALTASPAISERLAALREAVSALDREREAAAKSEGKLAWGNWGGGWGWGWPNWPNWHNWRNWGNWFRNW